jgi:hypothetical protein
MNCEHCNRELRSWKNGFHLDHGYGEWEEADPCPRGCEAHEEMALDETEGYYAFRVFVAKTLMNNASEDIKITKTLESLGDHIQEWWSEFGREAFLEENS